MPERTRTVKELFAALRLGDAKVQGDLLKRYEPLLRLMARVQLETQLRRKCDPSDVVQQTMLEACRALPSFRGTTEAEFAAWLKQILRFVLGHEERRYFEAQKRAVAREVSLKGPLADMSHGLSQVLAATSPSPSGAAMAEERELLLARALERLPPDYSEVIVLHCLQGLSHEEVAARMQRSAGAVRMLWVRALGQLRKEIERTASESAI